MHGWMHAVIICFFYLLLDWAAQRTLLGMLTPGFCCVAASRCINRNRCSFFNPVYYDLDLPECDCKVSVRLEGLQVRGHLLHFMMFLPNSVILSG